MLVQVAAKRLIGSSREHFASKLLRNVFGSGVSLLLLHGVLQNRRGLIELPVQYAIQGGAL